MAQPQRCRKILTLMTSPASSRRALTVWAVACAAYVVAVLGRTSFGVAGVSALDRFGVDAAALALFTAVQVGVYALCQIPVGLLIDRYGPKAVMVTGAVLMANGQVVLGLSSTLPVALGARVLIGAADATAFLAVMRLIPAWFSLRRAPFLAQITGALGQSGQFLSAVPFMAVLQAKGWTVAFVSLGALSALCGLAAAVVLRDGPAPTPRLPQRPPLASVLGRVVRDPYVRQGHFTHWVNMVPLTTFLLLWGVPTLRLGMGIDPVTVGWLLTGVTVIMVCAGPIHGLVSARIGRRRDTVALVLGVVHVVLMVSVLVWPGPPPLWALSIWLAGAAALIAASSYGFDTIRETADREVLGTATGLANVGGFLATMIAAQAMGVVLDVISPSTEYSWAQFRLAWLAPAAVWLVGFLGLLLSRRTIARSRGGGLKTWGSDPR